jgi:hypothetical protein
MYLNAAAYETKTNIVTKKYQQDDCKLVKIAQCKAENLV